MQYSTNSQTFRAKMAIGSWAKSPIYPGIRAVSEIIQKRMASSDNDFFEN